MQSLNGRRAAETSSAATEEWRLLQSSAADKIAQETIDLYISILREVDEFRAEFEESLKRIQTRISTLMEKAKSAQLEQSQAGLKAWKKQLEQRLCEFREGAVRETLRKAVRIVPTLVSLLEEEEDAVNVKKSSSFHSLHIQSSSLSHSVTFTLSEDPPPSPHHTRTRLSHFSQTEWLCYNCRSRNPSNSHSCALCGLRPDNTT